MGFRIQNNIAAMNTQRVLAVSGSQISKSLERLSSGYRINSAKDDAAGLAISQGFRANIASIKVAQRNISEANSLLQVADGAMNSVSDILVRMKELATQAASANVGSDLAKIDAEYGNLMQEVDRIVDSTKYAGTNLLDGSLGASVAGPATAGAVRDVAYAGFPDISSGILGDNEFRWALFQGLGTAGDEVAAVGSSAPPGNWFISKVDNATVRITNIDGFTTDTATVSGTADLVFAGQGITITNKTGLDADSIVSGGALLLTQKMGLISVDASGADAGTYSIADFCAGSGVMRIDSSGGESETFTGVQYGVSQTLNFTTLGISLELSADYTGTQNGLLGLEFDVTAGAPGTTGAAFQVGSEGNADNQISVSLSNAKTTDIGTGSGATAASLYATDLSSAAHAQEAMKVIDKAIADISDSRGNIGASQNRFAYAASNLSTTLENFMAADSVIRDVDMAAEMTSFTRNQILVQAATAMLAQANTAPQQLLSLLRG